MSPQQTSVPMHGPLNPDKVPSDHHGKTDPELTYSPLDFAGAGLSFCPRAGLTQPVSLPMDISSPYPYKPLVMEIHDLPCGDSSASPPSQPEMEFSCFSQTSDINLHTLFSVIP